jgi:hypothetical protein
MKYVVISRLLPGVDNAKHAFTVFGKVGTGEGTVATYAGTDGKTFVNIVDSDDQDMTISATYAPFFESTTVIPVVDLDDAWIKAVTTAIGNWG